MSQNKQFQLEQDVIDVVLPSPQQSRQNLINLSCMGIGTLLLAASFYGTDIRYYEYSYQPTPFELRSHIQKHRDEAFRLDQEYKKQLTDWQQAKKIGWLTPKPIKPKYHVPTPSEALNQLQNDKSNYYLVPTWAVEANGETLPTNPEYRKGKLPKLPQEIAEKDGYGKPYLKTVNDAPYNPYKALLGFGAATCFGYVSVIANDRVRKLAIAIPLFRTKINEFWAKGIIQQRLNLEAWLDYGQVQARVNAGRAFGDALFAGDITEAEYTEIRESAERQAQMLTESLQTKALPGQSLDEINDPKNKVSAGDGDNTQNQVQNQVQIFRDRYLKLIKEHENGWLEALKFKPVIVSGDMGSGKTSFTAALALLRFICWGIKPAMVLDPHAHQNTAEKWVFLEKLQARIYGGEQDWENINEGIQAIFERWKTRTEKDAWESIIIDELTTYSEQEPCAKTAPKLMQGVIGNPRKAHDAMILITHSNTNAGTGGSSGFSDAKKTGTIEIKLRSTNDMTPLYKGELIGYKDAEGKVLPDFQITIPEWLNPAKLYGAIAITANAEIEMKKQHQEKYQDDDIPAEELPNNLWKAAVQRLNDLLSQDAPKQPNDSNQSSNNNSTRDNHQSPNTNSAQDNHNSSNINPLENNHQSSNPNPIEDNYQSSKNNHLEDDNQLFDKHQSSDTNHSSDKNNLSNLSEQAQAFIKYMKQQNLISIKVRDAYRNFRFNKIRPNASEMKAIMQEIENANIGKLVDGIFTIY
ncbi:DEAD/DEAH box helicase family protein [Calothrix sp. PCC 6303]|uniref:DEAD/DEAH box helicase family protein n=1 Tax=Calothrix sp. PCC 6303 TaxID=1170562 RepID=UPI0002A0393D|nr:DEAD/DEAH box helicase family protein [Calothrix sp. PCC 6303]AFZ04623.1 hypothetical protein Cal6303_5760 [Calothrix sp. PCC 6303]